MTEFGENKAALEVYELVLSDANVTKDEVQTVVLMGAGRSVIEFADATVNGIVSTVRDARFLNPDA